MFPEATLDQERFYTATLLKPILMSETCLKDVQFKRDQLSTVSLHEKVQIQDVVHTLHRSRDRNVSDNIVSVSTEAL